MSLQVQCQVCFDSRSLTSIRVLPDCGHGFCKTCIVDTCRYNLKKGNQTPPCPMCRQPFTPANVIQVYLQPPDGPLAGPSSSAGASSSSKQRLVNLSQHAKSKVKHVNEKLRRLTESSTVDEVKRTTKSLLRAVELVQSEGGATDVAQTLLVAQYQLITRTALLLSQGPQLRQAHADLVVAQQGFARETFATKVALEESHNIRVKLVDERKRVKRRNSEIAELKDRLEQTGEEMNMYVEAVKTYKRQQREKIERLQKELEKRDEQIDVLKGNLQCGAYFECSSDNESLVEDEDARCDSDTSLVNSNVPQSPRVKSEDLSSVYNLFSPPRRVGNVDSDEGSSQDDRPAIRSQPRRRVSAGEASSSRAAQRQISDDEHSPSPRPAKRYRIVGPTTVRTR